MVLPMMKRTIEDVAVIGKDSIRQLDAIELGIDGAMILVDKGPNWTSFDVVARLRSILRIKRIGHCGTLDPMATGLLQICIGPATKFVDSFQASEKEYVGTMKMGATTPSDDAETDVVATFPVEHLTSEMLHAAANVFVGEIDQIPPMFSARKVDGKRLYSIARKGEVIERPSRSVIIRMFKLTDIRLPEIDFHVVCSKGTYIRSLVRDFGAHVSSGAHLTRLRRTRSGEYDVKNALTIDEFAAYYGLPGSSRRVVA